MGGARMGVPSWGARVALLWACMGAARMLRGGSLTALLPPRARRAAPRASSTLDWTCARCRAPRSSSSPPLPAARGKRAAARRALAGDGCASTRYCKLQLAAGVGRRALVGGSAGRRHSGQDCVAPRARAAVQQWASRGRAAAGTPPERAPRRGRFATRVSFALSVFPRAPTAPQRPQAPVKRDLRSRPVPRPRTGWPTRALMTSWST